MFDVLLLALLSLSFSINTADNPISKDIGKLYQFLVRDPSGKAATAFYVSKNVSVVEQLPRYIKDSKVINNGLMKKGDIDRALLHGAHDLVLTHDVRKSAKSSSVSLVLSVLWNTADRLGVSKYIYTESDLLNALVYGFVHSACLFAFDEQLKKLS